MTNLLHKIYVHVIVQKGFPYLYVTILKYLQRLNFVIWEEQFVTTFSFYQFLELVSYFLYYCIINMSVQSP